MDTPTLIGSVGVGILLLAFFLNLFGKLAADGQLYAAMNLAGGGLSCCASYLIDFMPFVVLEGTWAMVAAIALGKRLTPARQGGRAV